MSITIEHTEFSKTSPATVWKFWSDVSTWALWDLGVEWCKMKEGHSFKLHGEGFLLPRGAPTPVAIKITECTENKSFTDIGTLELGSIVVSHEVNSLRDGVEIMHRLVFTANSPQAEAIFKERMFSRLQEKWPETVKTLARLAEEAKE